MLNEMRGTLPTLDSGRGLTATVSDDGFRGSVLAESAGSRVTALGRMLARYPGVTVRVEGYSANAEGDELSSERASAVRRALLAAGVPLNAVSAAGLGDSRPLGPNTTAQERRMNTRVEIVVNGESIGHEPLWEHSSSAVRPGTADSLVGRVE
jgi:hypothetical protein